MRLSKTIEKQINQLISDLIACCLVNDQNFPRRKLLKGGVTLVDFGQTERSLIFEDKSYEELYSDLLKNRHFHIKMLDGALIALLYQFKDDQIIKHRLTFFPAPHLTPFQNDPNSYLEDELYVEIVEKNVVATPVRFDFDLSAFKAIEHPASHLTLGQYKNCRIPVSSALTPYQFISFIIDSFYNKAKNIPTFKLTPYSNKFPITIDKNEESLVHIKTCNFEVIQEEQNIK